VQTLRDVVTVTLIDLQCSRQAALTFCTAAALSGHDVASLDIHGASSFVDEKHERKSASPPASI
jgi:hypothetical protein